LEASLRMGRHSDADTHAAELLKYFPNDAELYMHRAEALAALQKSHEARECYEAAIRLAPSEIPYYQSYPQYLCRGRSKGDDAKGVLHRMVIALPHEAEPYITRSRFVSFLMNELDPQSALRPVVPPATAPEKIVEAAAQGVIADLRKALDLDPENSE